MEEYAAVIVPFSKLKNASIGHYFWMAIHDKFWFENLESKTATLLYISTCQKWTLANSLLTYILLPYLQNL